MKYKRSYYIDRDPDIFEHVLNCFQNDFCKTRELFDNFDRILNEMKYLGLTTGVQKMKGIYSDLITKFDDSRPYLWMKFCVGGRVFVTSEESLNCENSTLYQWINAVKSGDNGEILKIGSSLSGVYDRTKNIYYLDRNPRYFEYILDYLRTQTVNQNEEFRNNYQAILNEAQFYGMCQMVKDLLQAKHFVEK